MMLFTSCEKKEVIPNTTVLTDIAPTDWQYSTSTKTYYVTINMPEITQNVNRYYGIMASISSGNNLFEALPEVYNGYSYTYTHNIGILTLEVQRSDGATVLPPAYPITAKIVLIPSN